MFITWGQNQAFQHFSKGDAMNYTFLR